MQWSMPVPMHKRAVHTPDTSASTASAACAAGAHDPSSLPKFIVNGRAYGKLEAIGKGGSSKVYKVGRGPQRVCVVLHLR